MCKVYGYCRISTSKQNIERQVINISRAYPTADIRQEIYTGTKIQGRKELDRLLNIVKSGDTIVFDSVSRMSRNAKEGFELYTQLYNKGVELVFLKESAINTSNYRAILNGNKLDISVSTGDEATDEFIDDLMICVSRYMTRLAQKQIIASFEQAQKEVDDLHNRVSEGIQVRKNKGLPVGRQEGKKYTSKKSIRVKDLILKHCKTFGKGTLNDIDTLALINGNIKCSRVSYYKFKRELIEDQTPE